VEQTRLLVGKTNYANYLLRRLDLDYTRLCSESGNLCRGQNLKQKWSGIRIRIFGL